MMTLCKLSDLIFLSVKFYFNVLKQIMGLVRRKDRTIVVVDMKMIQRNWMRTVRERVEQDDQGNPLKAF